MTYCKTCSHKFVSLQHDKNVPLTSTIWVKMWPYVLCRVHLSRKPTSRGWVKGWHFNRGEVDTYRTEPAGVPSRTAWLDVSDAHVLGNAVLATSWAHSIHFLNQPFHCICHSDMFTSICEHLSFFHTVYISFLLLVILIGEYDTSLTFKN